MMVAQISSIVWGFLSTHKLLLALAFLVYQLNFRLNRYIKSPLRSQNIPGPLLGKFSSWYRAYYVLVWRNWHFKLQELHAEYGPIVWISPQEVSVSDPKLRGIIYAFADERKEASFFRKGEAFETGMFNEDFNFVFESDPAKARKGKYALSHPYSEQGLKAQEGEFDKAVEDLIAGLSDHFLKQGKLCNLSRFGLYYFYDLSARLAFGHSTNMCRAGGDIDGSIFNMRVIFNVVGSLVPVPFALKVTSRFIRKCLLYVFLEGLYRGCMYYGKDTGISKVDRIHEMANNNPNSLIAKFRDAEKKTRETFHQGNFDEAITNNVFFLYAGSTVASNNFPKVIQELYSHPEVLAKVRAELATLDHSNVTVNDLERKDGSPCRIPYTEAAILEALRLTPTFGPTLPRVVPLVGCQLNDYFIPPGYEVGMSGWTVNYDKSYFGDDAAEYKPERWLGNHPTELAKDGSGKPRTVRNYLEAGWFTFGAGARVCVGRNMTIIGFAKAVAAVTREFEVEIVKKPYFWYSLIVHAEDMMVRIKKRAVTT